MNHRLSGVAQVEAALDTARRDAIKNIRAMQETCAHRAIIASNTWGGRRICAECGLEEVSAYSWPSTTIDGGYYEFVRPAGRKTVLNSEFVKIGDVVSHRVRL